MANEVIHLLEIAQDRGSLSAEERVLQSAIVLDLACDILAQGLIGLIEYSYHQGIHSFLKAHLQRTSGLSVFDLEQFQDG
jgi:hypothetical protein